MGWVWPVWLSPDGHGVSWPAWRDVGRLGKAARGRRGWPRQGRKRLGTAGMARPSTSRRGMMWPADLNGGGAGFGPAPLEPTKGTTMIRYVFRDEPLTIRGAKKADPQRIGEALAKIADAAPNKMLAPEAVVDAARNPRHVLHRHFEWDDAAAAAAYRLDEARKLIRIVRVVDDDAEEGHTRAYVSIADRGGRHYHTAAEVKGNADLQAVLLRQADEELAAFQRRYRSLRELCEVIETARATIRQRRDETRLAT